MNILRHKSWHVRTKKNIARVRRDEENARKEEEAKQWRADNAEKSARIEFLRAKTSGSSSKRDRTEEDEHQEDHEEDRKPKIDDTNKQGSTKIDESKLSFQLFQDHKDKGHVDKDRDEEKKAEQEKWEVKAGIFSYLDGRYSHQKNDEDQWYTKSAKDRLRPEDKINIKDDKVKTREDPLEKIKFFTKEIERNRNKARNINQTTLKSSYYDHRTSYMSSSTKNLQPEEETPQSTRRIESPKDLGSPERSERIHKRKRDDDSGDGSDRKKRKKSKKKHSKKSKKRSRSSDSESEAEIPVSKALIDKLRQERLERERNAKEQTRIVLNLPDTSVKPQDSRTYNSQFNPHLVRK